MVDGKKDEKARKADELRDRFLKLSGYSDKDVDDQNDSRRTFVTANGGKYQLTKTSIRRLSGPEYPNENQG